MFGPPGFAYVYRSYGIHWCLNFVCEAEGSASAVLIRRWSRPKALARMRRRRAGAAARRQGACARAGKLCQALGVTHQAQRAGRPSPGPAAVRAAGADGCAGNRVRPRIGITKAVDEPWRYGLAGVEVPEQAVLRHSM